MCPINFTQILNIHVPTSINEGSLEELKSKFDLFYNEMTSYAEFLEKTASLYERTDQAIQQAANDILSN